MRSSHLEKILGRLDDLDATNLTILVQRLARERALLETVFNTIKEGVLVVDEAGLVEYCNASAQKILGIQDKDVGSAILWKYAPNLSDTISRDLAAEVASGTVVRELLIDYPESRYVRLYIVPFELPQEKSTEPRYALIVSDITEDKISTEAFIESEKLSSIMLLAAGVAHELGNPLNSINIHLQVIQRELSKLPSESASKVKKSVDICTQEVNRLDLTIKHFLEAIRPTIPDRQPIQMLEMVQEVLGVLAQELEDLSVDVELTLDDDVPVVLADKNQISQALFNVIRNASESMDAGGKLKITTRSDSQYLYLYFADTGVGISPEDLARVFEPYYTTKQGGHGLGMMIVQRIMRDHGGYIGIDSKQDVGTVVTLQFPLRNPKMKMLEGSD